MATEDLITRRDVDDLSAKILINFGIINAAALAATLAGTNSELGDNSIPFAIGLISAIISQIYWYYETAISYGLKGYSPIQNDFLRGVYHFVLAIIVIGAGCLSGACLIFGGLIILKLSICVALIITLAITFIPIVMLFYYAHKYRYLHDNSDET